MKRRGFPLWLLRDVPALLGVMLSFWRLVIFVIASEATAVRDVKLKGYFHIRAAKLIASAEARLDYALWREAYRRLGWAARLAPFNTIVPPEATDIYVRFHAYRAAFRDMESVVRTYVEHLRQQYAISQRALVAHGSTDARLCRAARHELVREAATFSQHAPFALILSIAHRARPSTDERGHARARGPPSHLKSRNTTPRRLHLRERDRMPAA